MWKNIVEPGRSYMTAWRICIACWFPKATIHTLRICNTHCFSTVSVVAWTRLVVTINVQCLSCLVSYPSLYVRTFLAVSYLMFYNKVFYAFFFPTRVTWRDYPILFDVTIIIIQSDSFGTRPKKMRISERLFIRFWTCIYDYIPCFMRSMSILLCRSLDRLSKTNHFPVVKGTWDMGKEEEKSWRHRENDWLLVPCRALPCHCVVQQWRRMVYTTE